MKRFIMLQAVLFDLDGTLADTARDLSGALNDLLKSKGLPEKNADDIRPFVAQGSAALIQLGANISPNHPDFAQWQNEYLAFYESRIAKETVLFDEVNTVLNWLAQHHILWGIVTNKHQRFTAQLLPFLNFQVPPNIVVSGDTCARAKPHPDSLLYACRQLNRSPENCLYVGDGERDIQASKNANMPNILALWGYIAPHEQPETWQADYVAHNMLDVLSRLQTLIQAA